MITHSTNYFNTFISIAEDCPALCGELPALKGTSPTVAGIEYEMIVNNPYKYTSDEVLFEVYAIKNDITEAERAAAREHFFSKGQACLRASPLTKRYGWGVHSDEQGRIAIYGVDTAEYKKLSGDLTLKQVKAMRSSRK